jgi:hypothetical protein
MAKELLNIEYELNPLNSSGASEGHIHTERQAAFQKHLLVISAAEEA